MLYKPDWEKTQQKYIEFWNKENHDRPLIAITAPKDNHIPKQVSVPEKLIDRWTDIEYIIKSSRERFASTFFGGEAYPDLWPNLGPDIFAAIIGEEIEFGGDTSWAKHTFTDWSDIEKIRFDPENKWWKKIKAMTEAVVDDSKDDYHVGITDLHIGADALVSLRGPENASFDLYDYPADFKKATFAFFDIFKTVFNELYSITSKNQKGCSNWLGPWCPDKWYTTSCDFMGMISRDMYKEFVEKELLMEIDWLGKSIFHLDGPGALIHLDALLEIPELNGIQWQWVFGPGQPTAKHWIHVLKKIQDAGKLIFVDAVPEDIDILLDELKPEGLMIGIMPNAVDMTRTITEQEARDIIKKVENSYKRKLYSGI